MNKISRGIIALVLGVGFAFASVSIVGIGAAMSVPANIITPISQWSELFATILVDLVTIAIPLVAAFLLVSYICQRIFGQLDRHFVILLLVPLVLFQIYTLVMWPLPLDAVLSTLPRYLLLVLCGCFLIKGKAGYQS